ncbi:MAG: MMPL family transporter [Pseudohongiella sp.]|nr:MMPL family transporter [Pseudohongiella sp.]
MENRLLVLSRLFAAAPALAVRYRAIILLTLIMISVLLAWGVATRTRIDMSVDSFLDQSDPAITALNNFRTQFGSDDSLFLVYEARDGDVFSARSLKAVQALTEKLRDWRSLDASRYEADLSELDIIRRVQSITTLRVQRVDGDTLRSERLVPEAIPDNAAGLAAIRERAMAEDDYKLAFYSADGRFGALLIQTTFGAQPVDSYVPAVNAENISLGDAFSDFGSFDDTGSFELSFDESATVDEINFDVVDMGEYKSFYSAVSAVYADHESELTFYPAGNPSLMSWVFDVLQDMLWLAAGMIAIFVFLLRTLFRSFSAVVWSMVTILLSLLWSWGLMVWFGATLSTMVTLTVMLVFATGIAGCVHVMSAYFVFRQQSLDHETALSRSYEKTGLAIMVTSITTMAGVLSLAGTDLIPIQVFGVMSALGVFLAFVFTVVLLPILLSIWHPSAAAANSESKGLALMQRWQHLPLSVQITLMLIVTALMMWAVGVTVGLYLALIGLVTLGVLRWQNEILAACPGLVARRPWTILSVFAAIFAASVYGTSQVRIDSNVAELARADSAPRIAYNMVDEHMAGAQTIAVMIDTGISDGLMEPALLRAIETLQEHVIARYDEEVSRTYSLANIVKDTYRVMNQDNPAFYRIPDDAVTISQLLYLFNSANPEERRSLVSDDFSRSHITINAYNAGSYQYTRFFEELDQEIVSLFDPLKAQFPDLQVTVTGSVPLMMRAMDEIAQSQYSSFLIALSVISVIMIITLGSVQAGLISVIPNLIPALMTFGLMGLLGITLDTDTLLIAPVIIGVAVDDTIHFMTSYRLELIKTRDMKQALHNTLRDVGRAVMFTTMILGLGFAILGFSEYLGIAKIGIFGGLAIFMALLCDLLLLPALIMKLQPRFGLKGPIVGFGDTGRLVHEHA